MTTLRAPPQVTEARAVQVRGVVQGVGFRPFVHRLAARHGLDGWVRNESGVVHMELDGSASALDRFLRDLEALAPPMARIDAITVMAVPSRERDGFAIVPSEARDDQERIVSPDVGMCAACERDLRSPRDRRYRYPFTTCTDCGPRYTVIEDLPYDRERTSMRPFTMCPACRAEYASPANRRHHSQTNSCPQCGPQLEYLDPLHGVRISGDRGLHRAAAMLRRGGVVAIRGLGGFQLAVDATNPDAVTRLRVRKCREAKPFAVMVASLAEAERLATIGRAEREALVGPERPIVLLPRRSDAHLAPGLCPGLSTVGLMLACTPLHRLLLDAVGRPLVMTSGNAADEPIAVTNEEAASRLAPLSDAVLQHDRPIVTRCDDSVLRVADGQPVFLRRARGYAPLPVDLPVATAKAVLAVGPHLKNTLTLAQGGRAWVSQHIGDLENLETLEHFRATRDRLAHLLNIQPAVVAHDLHPGYLSTREALALGLPVLAVQHHHAHIAAVAAEHGVSDPVLGLAFDGTGYGDDGRVWGAEFLIADLMRYTRVAHLRYAPLPGGDLAARRPWRCALGYASLVPGGAPWLDSICHGIPHGECLAAQRQAEHGLNAPLASSMGRLFDAAAAIIGVRQVSTYEAQAAAELESVAMSSVRSGPVLPVPVLEEDRYPLQLDPIPLLTGLAIGRAAGDDPADLAARFHRSVAEACAALALRLCEMHDVTTVCLGGGVFQNALFLTLLRRRLGASGLRVLVPHRLGPNDGAISYGQAAVAAATFAAGEGG